MNRKCAKCEASFDCRHEEGGCWCEGLLLSQENLRLLNERYVNCLCPGCLSEFAQPEERSAPGK